MTSVEKTSEDLSFLSRAKKKIAWGIRPRLEGLNESYSRSKGIRLLIQLEKANIDPSLNSPDHQSTFALSLDFQLESLLPAVSDDVHHLSFF